MIKNTIYQYKQYVKTNNNSNVSNITTIEASIKIVK